MFIDNCVLKNGKPQMYLFDGGYYSFDGDKRPECHYYIADYQGNNRMVVNARTNEVEQTTHYYPYGGIIGNLSSNQEAQKYKYSNKELDRTYGLDLYDFQARLFNPALPVFDRPDPLAEDFTWVTPYNYCAGDPVNLVDPTGQAWMPTGDNSASFLWIPEEQSFKPDGTLKDGLYRIAIGFAGTKNKWSVTFYGSEHNWADKEYNSESNYNIGTSKATVYCEDGTTKTYDACTMPSDLNKYPTTPEGQYEAMVGDHNGYQALKMGDVGTMNESVAKNKTNSIDLGKPNIAHPEQGNVAKGVDIHKAGKSNFTAVGSNGKPVSAACLLIDRTHWNDFMSNFSNGTLIGVQVRR